MRMGQGVGFVAAVAVTAVLAAGCGGDDTDAGDAAADSTATTTADATPAEPDAALLALAGALDDEGVLPVETAEQLFAAYVAPLDGVEPLTLPGDAPHDVAGMAIRRLLGALAELPPAVADAVTAAVEPAEGEEEAEIAPGARHREVGTIGGGDGRVPALDVLEADVAGIIAGLEERSRHDLRLPVRLRTVPDRVTGGDAVTTGIGPIGAATGCRIALPNGLFRDDGDSVTSTVAHEVWHCFQLDANETAYETGPEWIIEGQAEWAGEDFVGGSASSATNWNTWLLGVGDSLFRRAYDALGVYAVADAAGSDPWQTMLPMLDSRGSAAVETLFGDAASDAVRTLAQALTRAPDVGETWESTGPGITDAAGSTVLAVTDADPVETEATVGRFATLPVVLAIRAGDVLSVTVQGGDAAAVAVPGAGTSVVEPGSTSRWCLRDGGCECPDGSNPGGGEALPTARPGEGAAAVGSLDGGDLAVSAKLETLEDACNRSLVGTWRADVGAVLAILTAPYGSGGPACSGPYDLVFGEDGSFLATFQATCTVGSVTANATAEFSGGYTDDGSTFTVLDITGSGEATANGVPLDLPIVDGLRQAFSNPSPYSIEGDVLVFSFDAPDGNTFTFSYTRVA